MLSPNAISVNVSILSNIEHVAFFFFHALFLQWPDQFFHLLDLFYQLAVPPFLGQEKTAVVQDCQHLFSETLLRSAWQNHLQTYSSDEEGVLSTRTRMAIIMKQLDFPCTGYMQLQQGAIPAQGKQCDTSHDSGVAPFPWESLVSVILRTSHLFGLGSPQHLLRPAFSLRRLEEQNLLALVFLSDYAFLEYILHLERERLYYLTVHQFARPLRCDDRYVTAAEQYPFLQTTLLFWLFPNTDSIRVCPRCLAEEAYDRLYWTAQPVLVCPYHYLRLVQICPSCQQRIPTLRPSLLHCPVCLSGDYRCASPASLSEDHPLALASVLFLRALGVLSSPSWHVPDDLAHSPLFQMRAEDYFLLFKEFVFEFLSALPRQTLLVVCNLLDRGTSESTMEQEKEEPDTFFLALLLFHLLFATWPTSFFTGLDALCCTIMVPLGQRFDYGFGQCRKCIRKFFHEPNFLWLRQAFEQYEQQLSCAAWYKEAARQEQESLAVLSNIIARLLLGDHSFLGA